jgi:uracil-DNA glycosylase family 4
MVSLEELRMEIVECRKCREYFEPRPWIFPSEGDVKGFLGDGRVTPNLNLMFIAYRPSTLRPEGSRIKEERRRVFYELLKEFGFENAHLTDITKCRRPGKFIAQGELRNCLSYLEKEIRTVKPDFLIAVGEDAYMVLPFALELLGLRWPEERILKIRHYAFRKRRGEGLDEAYHRFMEEYRHDFRRLANSLKGFNSALKNIY